MTLLGKEKHFGTGIGPDKKVGIGIDQSLTGFAFAVVSAKAPSEHYDVWVYRSPYNGVQRLEDIRHWMNGKLMALSGHDFVDVAMEGTVLASHSALVLGELSATVKLTLYEYGITPLQVPPMTLKKYATGKGTSKKQEMMMQIYKRWGVELSDDNAADGYALARLASGSQTDAIEAQIISQMTDLKYRDSIQ